MRRAFDLRRTDLRRTDLRRIELDDAGIAAAAALLQRAFPRAEHVTSAYLDWLYRGNPEGEAFGWNAFDGERLVSHCVVVPLRARLFGEVVSGVLSLNAATDPDDQGGGVYFELARRTYADAREAGHHFGVAVTNERSTAGFVSRVGFQVVAPLEARVGLGRVRRRSDPAPVDFERLWSPEARAWRLACPTTAELPATALVAGDALPAPGLGPLDVWVGLDPDVDWSHSAYAPLPRSLRPSSLNLIFRDLSGQGRQLDPLRVRWRGLDFAEDDDPADGA